MSAPKRIRSWLKAQKKSQAWLAKEIGVRPQRLCDYMKGRRPLKPAAADAIELATGGAVTMREVLLAR